MPYRESCYAYIRCIISQNIHISVGTAAVKRNEMWSVWVRKVGQERNQITEWYLFLDSVIFSMDLLHSGRLFIHFVFLYTDLLHVCMPPCYQLMLPYIRLTFWMSPALNPLLWSIFAFGFCSMNRHSHFSYRHTVHTQLNETSTLWASFVFLSCKCKHKSHTNNLCA
jgi:hypothetical protein